MQTIFVLKIPRETFFWGTLRTPAEKDFVTPYLNVNYFD